MTAKKDRSRDDVHRAELSGARSVRVWADATSQVFIAARGGSVELEYDEALAAADALDDAIVIAHTATHSTPSSAIPASLEQVSDRFIGSEFTDGWSAMLSETAVVSVAADGSITLTTQGHVLVMDIFEAAAAADALDELLYEP